MGVNFQTINNRKVIVKNIVDTIEYINNKYGKNSKEIRD